ncbi:MAG TPA: lipopolysaccharide transport periplasmic protein LptA [Acidiferrobacteraceae bacterium]|nr:lipopolysaccharide transport periplasmic protein LptA [Acidiferrobacteraceae bacterium]
MSATTQNYRLILFIGSLMLLATPPTSALKSDKDQAAIVDADNIEMDFNTGDRIYTGNVSVRQGSMLLRSDKLVVKFKDDALQNAVAYGKPARFRQRPDGKGEDVRGKALRIVFDEINNKIHLYNKAEVTQGQNTIKSKEIHYDMTTSKVIIKGAASSQSGGMDAGGRARIIIRPKESASGNIRLKESASGNSPP